MSKKTKQLQTGKQVRLHMAFKLNSLSLFDGFAGLVIEGEQRIGKTSYISQVVAEASGTWAKSYVTRLLRLCSSGNFQRSERQFTFGKECDLLYILKEKELNLRVSGYS